MHGGKQPSLNLSLLLLYLPHWTFLSLHSARRVVLDAHDCCRSTCRGWRHHVCPQHQFRLGGFDGTYPTISQHWRHLGFDFQVLVFDGRCQTVCFPPSCSASASRFCCLLATKSLPAPVTSPFDDLQWNDCQSKVKSIAPS